MNDETPIRRSRGRPRNSGASEPGTVQALERGLLLLMRLSESGRSSLTEVSEALDIPSATAYRMLTTLQKHGFVEFDEASQGWSVGVEAFRTGASFLRRTTLIDVAQPVLRALVDTTGETANLAVPHGGEVVFVGQRETPNPIRAFFHPGTRTPMHASGTGKAILAEMARDDVERLISRQGLVGFTENTLTNPATLFADLEATRTRGYSFDREERFIGMSCVGAVIRDATGTVVAGVSVSGPQGRFSERAVEGFGKAVSDAAARVSEGLGAVIA